MEQGKIYFAHPINTYDTYYEKAALLCLGKFFERLIIENPNQPCHQKGYKAWKKKRGNGMRYFYEEVLPPCRGGAVALPFFDGKLGAGVAGEIVWMMKKSRSVYVIRIVNRLFFDRVRVFTSEEMQMLNEWDEQKKAANEKSKEKIGNKLILSIEETRERTWEVLYKKFRPYEKAHLV